MLVFLITISDEELVASWYRPILLVEIMQISHVWNPLLGYRSCFLSYWISPAPNWHKNLTMGSDCQLFYINECVHEWVCVCNYMCHSMSFHSLLLARWLALSHLIVLPISTARNCVFVLTMRACLVNKIAEVEQGGPGSQVLNEPLGERRRDGRWATFY